MKIWLLVLIICVKAQVQWQSGFDFTIDDLKSLERSSSYPIHLVKEILFPRVFDEIPQILLMIETLDFQNGKDVDVCIFLGQILPTGFELRYRLGGPALIQKLKVRWVAMVDPNVQIAYHDLGFMDLKQLRVCHTEDHQGEGERTQEITIPFSKPFSHTARVATFLSGFKINPDGDSYCLMVEPDESTDLDFTLKVSTRYNSKVRFVTVAVLSTTDKSFILSKGGIDENALSYFEIDKVRDGIGRQSYEIDIPKDFFSQPHNNILSAGLSGFDVQLSDEGFVDLMLEHYFLRENKFHLNYGTSKYLLSEPIENIKCKLFELDFFVLLHLPALPDQVNEAKAIQNNKLMQSASKKEKSIKL